LIAAEYPPIHTDRAIAYQFGRMTDFGHLETAYKKVVGYSDVDVNGHLNNSKYVDFAMDCFPLDNYNRYDIKAIDIQYLNETLPGETIVLKKDISAANKAMIYIEGSDEEDVKTYFRAKVEIAQKE
jgi:acyl-ACP thioesterase